MSDRVPTLKDVREHIERRIRECFALSNDIDFDDLDRASAIAVRRELHGILAMLERVESGR